MELDSLQIKLCDIQGRLFELSSSSCYESVSFTKAFMNSKLAFNLDASYNRMQWAGEEYLLEELVSEKAELIKITSDCFSTEMMYWSGYLYRYWHFYTGENSKKIYVQADIQTLKRNYLMFHTMEPSMAVDNLKEIHIKNTNE